jgi:tripartite-type tricarboxylate transporter receptor subunit TctC
MKRVLALALLLAFCAGNALAQSAPWPSKPVRLVVPFGPGGAADLVARILTDRLSPTLGQPVIIEHRPGAGQNIGTAAVVRSAPDGYTFLIASEVILQEHLFDKDVPFVGPRDLVAIARVSGSGTLLVVPPQFPARTLAEFIAAVKASPGKYNFATVNNFELPEMVDFRDRFGLQMVLVPFKSGPAAMQAIASGEAHIFASSTNDAATFGDRVKPVAYTGPKPHLRFPNSPTVAASGIGIPDFDSSFAFSIFGPTGTPADVVNKMHAAVVESVRHPEVQKRYGEMGYETYTPTIAELNAAHAAKTKRIEAMLARGLKLR